MNGFRIVGNILQYNGMPFAVLLVPNPVKTPLSFSDQQEAIDVLNEGGNECPSCGEIF